jgi:hypothetical protein
MEQHPVMMWFYHSWLGEAARHVGWLFTTGLIVHFFGICLLIGTMLVVDLRLLGVVKIIPFAGAFRLLPIAIAAIVINAVTGLMFYCFDPSNYWFNPAFRLKLILLVLAGLNALWFTVFEHQKLKAAPDGYTTSLATKLSAGASLLIWFTIIVLGRFIVVFQGGEAGGT